MCLAARHIEAVQPRPRSAAVGREVHQGAAIPRDWVAHARVVTRNLFGHPTTRVDAPDVHLIGRVALDEVNEGLIGRPQGEVGVEVVWCGENRLILVLSAVPYEHRITRSGRVEHESRRVGRPVELGRTFQYGFGSPPRVGIAQTLISPGLVPIARAQNVTSVPSGEKPSVRTDALTTSFARPRVRLTNWPVPICVTQTSICPSRSERNATKLPSLEIAAACSVPLKSVKR